MRPFNILLENAEKHNEAEGFTPSRRSGFFCRKLFEARPAILTNYVFYSIYNQNHRE